MIQVQFHRAIILYIMDTLTRDCPQLQVTSLLKNLNCRHWALPPNTVQEPLSSHYVHCKIALKLGRTKWTQAKNNTFLGLFHLFVALSFMSADYFLHQRLILFVIEKNLQFPLSQHVHTVKIKLHCHRVYDKLCRNGYYTSK